ncbi:hypothetical protein LXL04_013084 [Taraxacum kok-saghyz]
MMKSSLGLISSDSRRGLAPITFRYRENQNFRHKRGVDFISVVSDVHLKELNLYNPDESIVGFDAFFLNAERPFKILDVIGTQAFKLELPQELQGIHDTFHVSYLKKYCGNEELMIPLQDLKIDEKK